ncbi:hypothetical protein Y032_0017g3442 [Ancylostoma ceylanicum]|uniref:Uncharacterized protein n=1 Tax=Ancylostoma ceylanicum TaxID=53326 RepID=A0A016V5R5_9BILA|nr:hypothetical protein Y032_0017g3442 [Ancylostoma ceylanicum]
MDENFACCRCGFGAYIDRFAVAAEAIYSMCVRHTRIRHTHLFVGISMRNSQGDMYILNEYAAWTCLIATCSQPREPHLRPSCVRTVT